MQILALSNGHGEDIIAVRILEELRKHSLAPSIFALPLVGEGHAYQSASIPLVGPVQKMPSGGFIYMDSRQLWRDLQGGLLGLTLAQYKVISNYAKKGCHILAVGDLVPLLFAWLSGANYTFVGTAKSEYYLRDEQGWLPNTSRFERLTGSVYLPWERSLMLSKRCQAVFPRDNLTTEILKTYKIPAYSLGNPMMDGLQADIISSKNLTILLLPGSRSPEVERNWKLILAAVHQLINTLPFSITFITALAPSLDSNPFKQSLLDDHWLTVDENWSFDPLASQYSFQGSQMILTQHSYSYSLSVSNLAIAMAGTATEQFVGLGKPVITLPGEGPQFTYAFAEAQTRLLGSSVFLVEQPEEVPAIVQEILNNPSLRQDIAINGQRRLGSAGAAKRIADFILSS